MKLIIAAVLLMSAATAILGCRAEGQVGDPDHAASPISMPR